MERTATRALYDRLGAGIDSLPRGDGWIQTFTGKRFWPLDPRPGDVDIIDIAAALGKLCRYNGHCRRFYSVAEHCVLMAEKAPPRLRKAMLLHDAPEYVLGDFVRPVKVTMPEYGEAEQRVLEAVAERFNEPLPFPPEVHEYDMRICLDERAQNMAPPAGEWEHIDGIYEPLGVTLKFWTPRLATAKYLMAFLDAGGVR